MSLLAATLERRTWPWILPLVLVCVMGILLSLSGHPVLLGVVVVAALGYGIFGLVSIREPLVLVAGLLLVLEVFPPFYFDQLGETPFFVSFLFLPIVLVIIVIRFPDIHFEWDPIARGLAVFLAGTALSIPFAFWLSGTAAGVSSLSRWLLLSHALPIYYLIRGCGHSGSSRTERRIFSLLLGGAVLSAAYGIVDFVWPIPLAHPSADQFIWLEGAILRRAQGPFYESSNFANFCGFFLIAAAVAFLAHREHYLGVPRWVLMAFISILGLAILVAFSRSTWASILAALFTSLLLSRFVKLQRGIGVLVALLVPLCLLWMFSPALWDYLVGARVGRLFEILDDPNYATSGRFDTWLRVLSIMRDEPQYLFFGIGYKTLTVTRLFRGEIITDNGYLSLLLETGIAGLTGFLLLSAAILRVLFRLAHSARAVPAFWATVLFSIWCGELVQLLAADAYTYWRNIAVFAAMAALTLNLAEQADLPSPGLRPTAPGGRGLSEGPP
jgi:O-Antigen ligase